MKSFLICHHDDALNYEGMARWLASFSDLQLVVVIEDPPQQVGKRIRAELRRSGWLGLIDALAFRAWFNLSGARKEARWEKEALENLQRRFPASFDGCHVLRTDSPNHPEVETALREISPDFGVARCKRIISKRIYSIPRDGIYVIHPGICPEYRNAHGCFWAITQGDTENVGATLLRIDSGIDTGPVLGYFRESFDPLRESHLQIQNRVVIENLDGIADLITRQHQVGLEPIDTSGRDSNTWGQPRLSSYLAWRRRFRRSRDNRKKP